MQSQEAPQSKLLLATTEEMKQFEPRAQTPQTDVAHVGGETTATTITSSA